MAFLPLRDVGVAESAAREYERWLGEVAEALSDPAVDRNELCRRLLTEIYYPQFADMAPAAIAGLPTATRVALLQMDPRNITVEAAYYAEIDTEKYARVKPLLWLWEMFDKSPLGENVELGIRFRRLLARHI